MLADSIPVTEIAKLFSVVIFSMSFSFLIAFPIIALLYKFNITRRMTVDFTTLIEKRNLKIGVPIMGGLIVIVTVLFVNVVLNPYRENKGMILMLVVFLISAFLGGFDDVLNIYGKERKQRSISRTVTLIKVHKSIKKRLILIITFPWEVYKRFFFILGSNPGKGIQAHEKILVQSIAGLLLGVGLFSYASRANPGELWVPILNSSVDIGILIIPFAWITVLLMTNAVNLADGMDGLSASELFASFLGFLIIAILKEDLRSAFLIASVLGSLLTYLYFNIPPARFQMGDVGSLSLGALLAAVAFMVGEPLMLLIIAFPFVVTLASSVIQGLGRRLLGRRVFRMAPLHYHFQMSKEWSEEKVVMRFALFSLACAIFGIWVFVVSK